MSDFKSLNGYNAKDAIARDRLNANQIGTAVALAGKYHPDGLPSGGYVIPSDGYLTLTNTRYSSDSMVKVVVNGSNGSLAGEMVVLSPYDEETMFVKKGMIVASYTLISGTSATLQTYLYFRPLT